MIDETEHTCQFCYYEYFDGRAYPCSMCVCGEERKDMFQPKGRQNKRKTDNNSEKPNNCEKDCFLCKWLGDVDVCGRCRNRNLFAEADTEPTISKMEQVDKDINVPSKDETRSDARKFLGYACETCKHRDEEWDSEACDGCCENNDHYEAEDEPQTEYKKWEVKPSADMPTENTTCVGVATALIDDEPQTDCPWK